MSVGASLEAGDRAVPELRPWRDRHAAALQPLQPGIEGDLAERDHHAHVGQRVGFGIQMILAARDLLGRRLVLRRRAADRGQDVGVTELQPVVDTL